MRLEDIKGPIIYLPLILIFIMIGGLILLIGDGFGLSEQTVKLFIFVPMIGIMIFGIVVRVKTDGFEYPQTPETTTKSNPTPLPKLRPVPVALKEKPTPAVNSDVLTISNEYIVVCVYHIIAYLSLFMGDGGYGIGALLVPLCWIAIIIHLICRLIYAIYKTVSGTSQECKAAWRRLGGVFVIALVFNGIAGLLASIQ